MDLIITLLSTLMLGSVFWGLICLFKKGRRLRGLAFIFIAPFVLIIAITYFSILEKDRKAQEAGYANFEAQEIAELNLQAQSEGFDNHADKLETQDHIKAMALKKEQAAKAGALKKALKGFPDEGTLMSAKNIGIKRFEAYRLLNDAEAMSKYCGYTKKANQIAEAKLSELDDATDQAAETKVWEKYEIIQDEGLSEFNREIKLRDLEYLTLANVGYWNWHCRAAEKGWKVLNQTQAESSTRSDAQEAERALTAFYLWNLKNQTSYFSTMNVSQLRRVGRISLNANTSLLVSLTH